MNLSHGDKSLIEEALSILTLIAALLAYQAELRVLAILLGIKAASDMWIALRHAWKSWRAGEP